MAVYCQQYIEKYRLFVTNNPLLASEVEVALKWASYIVAGRFSQSPVVTELIHSASKLLTLVNDSILRKAAGFSINTNSVVEKLKTYLAIIEYAEVFVEVGAHQISGTRGKWLTVILLHLIKFTINCLLLLKYNQGICHSPPIQPLNRTKDIPELNRQSNPECYPNVEVTFTLSSSGRIVRSLHAAPPLVPRTWQVPKVDEDSYKAVRNRVPSKLSGKYLTGEMLHLLRPLVHLASMGVFGEFSWKPFLIAMGIDVT
ncbi:peroxisomal membrane protein PEX16, partial [Caerostris extrusa]